MRSTRNERRQARKTLDKRALSHPAARRILRNIRSGAGNAALETYQLDDDGTGKQVSFDVFSLNVWARANLPVESISVDWRRVDRLLESGAVDLERIADHTLKTEMTPLLICKDVAGSGQDQIVDGSHRYVAFAMATQALGLDGLCMPAFLLTSAQWRPFIIPDSVMKALFDAKDDASTEQR